VSNPDCGSAEDDAARRYQNSAGNVVTDEIEQAHRKVVGLALNGPAN